MSLLSHNELLQLMVRFELFLSIGNILIRTTVIYHISFFEIGGEINDCMMIDDDDLIVISDGSPFIMRSDDDATNKVVGVYKVDKLLGRGSFGVVKLGINMLNNQKIALKFLKKSKMQSIGSVNRVTNELQCLSVLKHKNIIKLHSVS